MFEYWSTENMIVEKGLQIQHAASWTGSYNQGRRVYEYHRIATKSYHYFGMSEAAARACQAAKLAQYTREFTQYYSASGVYLCTKLRTCCATVSLDYDEADLWMVRVDVNEDQTQYYPGYLYDPEGYGLFEQFDYDESPADGAYLRITEMFRSNARLYIRYERNIPSFAYASLVVEYSADRASWTAVTPSSAKDGEVYFNYGWSAGWYRLRWGARTVSNAEQSGASREYSGALLLYSPYWQLGAWRMQYSADFEDFDRTQLEVKYAADGSTYVDITSQCDISATRIITPLTDGGEMGSFKVAYGETVSDPVHLPYNPDADTGDGSITVLGARLNTNGGDGFYEYVLTTTVGSFNAANLTAKISADGITWTALTLTTPTESGGKIYGTFDTSTASLRYVKFFYSGVQASGAFATPYHAADDTTLYHLGMYPSAIPYIFYGQTIADFDVTNMALEESTDGGGTWSAVALASSGHDATHLVLLNEPDASTPRLLRLVYDGSTISGSLKYPLA
ncbi:MAG: hypothetical protein IKO72_12250 [Kiritimatiellae bacterium]|nr:hypothetical protein [Kiritimatiellia bacterium]